MLTIAHLDHDHENHAVTDDRLAALCQACHLGYDHSRHVEKARLRRDAERGQLQLIPSHIYPDEEAACAD